MFSFLIIVFFCIFHSFHYFSFSFFFIFHFFVRRWLKSWRVMGGGCLHVAIVSGPLFAEGPSVDFVQVVITTRDNRKTHDNTRIGQPLVGFSFVLATCRKNCTNFPHKLRVFDMTSCPS